MWNRSNQETSSHCKLCCFLPFQITHTVGIASKRGQNLKRDVTNCKICPCETERHLLPCCRLADFALSNHLQWSHLQWWWSCSIGSWHFPVSCSGHFLAACNTLRMRRSVSLPFFNSSILCSGSSKNSAQQLIAVNQCQKNTMRGAQTNFELSQAQNANFLVTSQFLRGQTK